MPGNSVTLHPSGKVKLFFTEADHVYQDEKGTPYTSGTTLMKRGFPDFNTAEAASRLAAKEGTTPEAIIAGWENRSRLGTRSHENAEFQIRGQFDRLHVPENEEERCRFSAVWKMVDFILKKYRVISPEMVVFSPRYLIAGSIDLLVWDPADQEYLLLDWKFIKTLEREGFGGRMGILPWTRHLPDSNFWHYAMQLNIYEAILRLEGYIPWTAKVRRFLNVYDLTGKEICPAEVPPLPMEAMAMIGSNVTLSGQESLPF